MMEWIGAAVTGAVALGGGGFALGHLIGCKRTAKNGNGKNGKGSAPITLKLPDAVNFVREDVCILRHQQITDTLNDIKKAVKPIPVIEAWVQDQKDKERGIQVPPKRGGVCD